MSPVIHNAAHASTNGHTNGDDEIHVIKEHASLDGFGTRAIHVGSEASEETGAVIPAISLSTTYKQHGVGNHKVRLIDIIITSNNRKGLTRVAAGLRIFPLWQP